MTQSIQDQMTELKNAIEALEAQRPILGDALIETALAPMREKLAALATLEALPVQRRPQTRKMVSVLFADIPGCMAMSETMDAEELTEIMNALWKCLDAVIAEHGGRIDKHMGDAIMAVWGADIAREDDPERAIRAALAMRKEIESRDREGDREGKAPPPLSIRIGINTGTVLLGEAGTTHEYTAMGDTVNTASRLQHAAPLGGILISHDTYRQVRGIFDVQALEPLQVKGKAEPVQSYLVQQARPRAFRNVTRGVEGAETRMVGRDAELWLLQDAFHTVARDGKTHVVTIVGDAGVGKSRLLYEFDRWLRLSSMPKGPPDQAVCFKGRATPAMQAIPYSLIRDMFAYHFDIRDSDSAALVLAKFRAGMEGILDPDRADLVGHLVGFDFHTAGSQAVSKLLNSPSFGQLARAYFTHYIREIATSPLPAASATVIFMEDIHWADDSSLDLLNHLATEIPAGRLLLVCLARPQLFERRLSWGSTSQDGAVYIQLDLKPLSVDESHALISQILHKVDAVPTALRDMIVKGAEGNPFYVEELVKMLIEDGIIVRGKRAEEGWRVALDHLAKAHVPPTLTGILQARLDSLPREEKAILQRASVVGRQFWDTAVAELAADENVETSRVTALLEAIQNRELVFRQAHSAFDSASEYLFKHTLLRDVTYETVLLKLRRVYHAQVAHWLEVNAGDRLGEYLALIAGHYELAGELAKAADYLQRSGEAAYKASAYRDAITTFERALARLPESETTARAVLLTKIGYAYRQVSDYPMAIQHLEAALSLTADLAGGAGPAQVAVLNGLGWAIMGQGKYEEAKLYLKRSLALAREIDDGEGAALALYHLGDAAFRLGKSEEAESYAAESLALCRQLDDRQGIANALRVLGFASYMCGEYEVAQRYHTESQAIFKQIGDRWGVATGFINLGETARRLGDLKQAARHYERSLPIFQEIDNSVGIAIAQLNLGHAYTGLGEERVAWQYIRNSLYRSSKLGAFTILLEALVGVASLWALAGRYAPAAEVLSLVRSHPAFNAEIEVTAQPVFSRLREKLAPAQLEEALKHGQSLNLDEVVAKILADRASEV